MAKKSFKEGLGSLIQQSRVQQETVNDSDSETEKFQNQIKQLTEYNNLLLNELSLWRQGKINTESFTESLTEYGLEYNPQTNSFDEI